MEAIRKQDEDAAAAMEAHLVGYSRVTQVSES